MSFAFDFCRAAFGADDQLSIAVVNADTGEAMILKCGIPGAVSLLGEIGSTLELRTFETFEGRDSEERFPPFKKVP